MSIPYLSLRKKTPRKDGRYPLRIMFTEKQRQIRKTLDAAFFVEEWDEQKKCYIGPGAKAINLKLQEELSKANRIRIRFHLSKTPLTQKSFSAAWDKEEMGGSFIEYMENGIESQYQRGLIQKATYVQKTRTLRRLQAFQSDVRFADLTIRFFERFDSWHSIQQRAAGNVGDRERERAIKHLREFVGKAFDEKLVERNVLKGFRMPKAHNQITFLEETEVKLLLSLYKDPDDILVQMLRVARDRGMFEYNIEQFASPSGVDRIQRTLLSFLIQCFTGMRYSDLSSNGPKSVKGKYLVYIPQKTQHSSGETVYMPISPILRWLIDEYKERKLFCDIGNQAYNRNLKDLADISQIRTNLTSHVARHTFATIYMANGGDLRSLMDLLGVRSLKTVMVYAHSSKEICLRKVMEAFKGF